MLQKTFTVDYLTKEVRKNNGEVPSVRVRNSHEPIIEPEVFDRVQEILAESTKRRAKVRTKHPFAGRLICGDCGSFYVYTDERWNKLVESVKVCRGGHLIFTLKDGRIVKVTLQDH